MLLVISIVLAASVQTAQAKEPQQGQMKGSERTAEVELRTVAKRIGTLRSTTWKCQDSLGMKRTKASDSVWSLPTSMRYRHWVATKWKKSSAACKAQLDRRTVPVTYDWVTAVNIVQRIYPGTKDWLLFISAREGGYGGFVMNHQGSGAGGWMQFMSSTYYAYNNRAYANARSRGFIVSESTNSWQHPMGQAITAGYMRYTGLDGCHWCL